MAYSRVNINIYTPKLSQLDWNRLLVSRFQWQSRAVVCLMESGPQRFHRFSCYVSSSNSCFTHAPVLCDHECDHAEDRLGINLLSGGGEGVIGGCSDMGRYFFSANTENESTFKGWGDSSATAICIECRIDCSTSFSMWVINEGRGWDVMINSM